jgi:tetraacyldisaccharide 4'-kinase
MIFLRKLLFPFSLLYDGVTALRNLFYDWGLFRSTKFDVPVIAVGNLSVGGTGKTPMIEYLIRLLSKDHKVAVLSRGYKRKSKGFVLANNQSTAASLGDEPFQYYRKFKNICVAVDENRSHGIKKLLNEKPEIILLDDAFQHRRVRASLYILLTAYADLYTDDLVLPAGNLRESSRGAARANIVVVTKCPETLSEAEQLAIRKKLGLSKTQTLFFSTVQYDTDAISLGHTMPVESLKHQEKILVAGIANPKDFFAYLQAPMDSLEVFEDHHSYSQKDAIALLEKAAGRPIVTTEKDYVRLFDLLEGAPLYYVPIRLKFLADEILFSQLVSSAY